MNGQTLTAVYAGSFDPFHMGHLDIVRRALEIFPRVVVAVLENTDKTPLLPPSRRVELIRATVRDLSGVEVASFSGLLVDFMQQTRARVILRGMRAVSDFEYEIQMANMNARMEPNVETIFLMASDRHQFIASSLVKDIARLGGDTSQFVSKKVFERLKAKFGKA